MVDMIRAFCATCLGFERRGTAGINKYLKSGPISDGVSAERPVLSWFFCVTTRIERGWVTPASWEAPAPSLGEELEGRSELPACSSSEGVWRLA